MKIPMRLTAVLLFVFLSCARSEPLPEMSKTYQIPTGTITVSVDSVAVNPAERLTVSVETHREVLGQHDVGVQAQVEAREGIALQRGIRHGVAHGPGPHGPPPQRQPAGLPAVTEGESRS